MAARRVEDHHLVMGDVVAGFDRHRNAGCEQLGHHAERGGPVRLRVQQHLHPHPATLSVDQAAGQRLACKQIGLHENEFPCVVDRSEQRGLGIVLRREGDFDLPLATQRDGRLPPLRAGLCRQRQREAGQKQTQTLHQLLRSSTAAKNPSVS